ncbi:MAG: recombinase family protein, partial [Clostridia bacterium]|nr:recombinase family protein [Clostridia bacterium]
CVHWDIHRKAFELDRLCNDDVSMIGCRVVGGIKDRESSDVSMMERQAKTRPQFNALIAACEEGAVNLVITKSISRFARNTLDALNYIRKLKALNIPIIFEKESVNTLEASGELMVTILASIAQQESASISQNVRMGINFGFQEGRGRVNFSSFLGYRKGDNPGT